MNNNRNRTPEQRRTSYINRMVLEQLGSWYSYCGDQLFYRGRKVDGLSVYEIALLDKFERNWQEAIRRPL
jgi:hypothetical protein